MQKSNDCTVFTANGRLIFDARWKRSKDNQEYCSDNLLPALHQVRTGNRRRKMVPIPIVDADNSMRDNGAMITKKRL
jgi:hypothetical protein